jgi:hypothetical protein
MGQMMICTSFMSRELRIFKIIIIYDFFLKFIGNKKFREMWWGRWWCVHSVCLIMIYVIFLEIIDNNKK